MCNLMGKQSTGTIKFIKPSLDKSWSKRYHSRKCYIMAAVHVAPSAIPSPSPTIWAWKASLYLTSTGPWAVWSLELFSSGVVIFPISLWNPDIRDHFSSPLPHLPTPVLGLVYDMAEHGLTGEGEAFYLNQKTWRPCPVQPLTSHWS